MIGTYGKFTAEGASNFIDDWSEPVGQVWTWVGDQTGIGGSNLKALRQQLDRKRLQLAGATKAKRILRLEAEIKQLESSIQMAEEQLAVLATRDDAVAERPATGGIGLLWVPLGLLFLGGLGAAAYLAARSK
jgi:hypothetical protein